MEGVGYNESVKKGWSQYSKKVTTFAFDVDKNILFIKFYHPSLRITIIIFTVFSVS